MRIVGGACSKRSIKVPKKGVRPTRAIVREAIFNIIGAKTHNADVLDIFAGSGALGIEAISRGARHCTFVEKEPTTLRTNIANLSIKEKVKVIAYDYRRALRLLRKAKFDLIFADPPYNKKLAQKTVDLIKSHALLDHEGMLIIEHSPRENISMTDTFSLFKHRKYGDTQITLLVHRSACGGH